jgi:sulfite reductase (NADPH) flavoprotein alpha-component
MSEHTSQSSATVSPQSGTQAIHILYGSQSGKSETLAQSAATLAKKYGLSAKVLGMEEVELDTLTTFEYLILVTSTFGEGEMPGNAEILWKSISQDLAPRLENIKYSVLARGDSSYDTFCQAGKDWDNRLLELGATRIADRYDCDVGHDDKAEVWLNSIFPLMSDGSMTPLIDTDQPEDKPQYTPKNPFPAKILVNRILTGDKSTKETRHYEISISGSNLHYEAGDCLSVIATNCPELVADIIKAIDCNGAENFPVNSQTMTLTDALRTHFEIKLPSKAFVEEIAKCSGDLELTSILESDDHDKLTDYIWGRDILDLLLQFPNVSFSATEFLALLKPLQDRAYSIASSGKIYPETIHLTVASVRYDSYGRNHKGVCSTFLADLTDENTDILCFFTPNKTFRVPGDDNLPMIMVGPGTGIAPFRAFLQERQFRNAKGKNWLFFGERHSATDFIYQKELEALKKSELLTQLDLAFSRDQEQKIYVQDRMREHGAQLFNWLEEGAYFFVCGDAFHMAKDVDAALHEIIIEHGKLSEQQAIEYVDNLKKDRRYVRDVY